ncbi:hypothetical protein MTO96_005447 [Rhipicephalus appendiculatus]
MRRYAAPCSARVAGEAGSARSSPFQRTGGPEGLGCFGDCREVCVWELRRRGLGSGLGTPGRGATHRGDVGGVSAGEVRTAPRRSGAAEERAPATSRGGSVPSRAVEAAARGHSPRPAREEKQKEVRPGAQRIDVEDTL